MALSKYRRIFALLITVAILAVTAEPAMAKLVSKSAIGATAVLGGQTDRLYGHDERSPVYLAPDGAVDGAVDLNVKGSGGDVFTAYTFTGNVAETKMIKLGDFTMTVAYNGNGLISITKAPGWWRDVEVPDPAPKKRCLWKICV